MDYAAASFDRWITTDPRTEHPFRCAGCDTKVYPDEADGECCEVCAERLAATIEAEHVECDCAECVWAARTLRATL